MELFKDMEVEEGLRGRGAEGPKGRGAEGSKGRRAEGVIVNEVEKSLLRWSVGLLMLVHSSAGLRNW